MDSWTITASIKSPSDESAVVFVFTVQAATKNDAFIIGCSKLYAMFAGTTTNINQIFSITKVTP